ncbi:DUF2840 domain-containing protein [Acidovorax sp. YS12]|nr:DUF2840 domain-containing protein [Acidovorax sp. YS12]
MMAPGSHLASAIRQAPLQAMVPQRPTRMRVSLAFVEDRVNVWLRFGQPTVEIVLDRWRRVAMFVPGTVCCRVKWIGNISGNALWQLLVMQAPTPFEDAQRVAGVLPGARVLLRADGEVQVKAVLVVIDAIEALRIDPCTVAASYWRKVGHRLGAGLPLPVYTAERHVSHLAVGGGE